MSHKDLHAIATLLRWREFQEDRASDTFRQRSHDAQLASQRSEQAEARVRDIRAAQDALLESPAVDLDRLRAVAAIEDAAWHRLQAAQGEQRDAETALRAACDAHVAARADTRVAQTRRDRVAASERDRAEKRQFDHMADLFNRNRERAE